MSLLKPDAYDRVIEKFNLSVHPGSPDDPPYPEPEYFLVGHPRGVCPWCKSPVYPDAALPGESVHGDHSNICEDWDEDESEDTNRIRYAAERLEDAMVRQP